MSKGKSSYQVLMTLLGVFIIVWMFGGVFDYINFPRWTIYVAFVLWSIIAFSLDLYTQGSCQEIVDSFASNNDNIKRFDMVSKIDLTEICLKSDFLVSVGNNVSGFQHSKLYEYISYDKPIIHFYYEEKDYVISRYPYALQIKIGDDISHSITLITDFLSKYKNVFIDKQQIQKIFICNSEENIKTHILREFNKGGRNASRYENN